MTVTTSSAVHAHRTQASTLEGASHRYQRWTREELEYVVTHTDVVKDEDLAVELGRTYFAMWSIQHRVRAGDITLASIAERFDVKPVELDLCPACFTERAKSGDCLC